MKHSMSTRLLSLLLTFALLLGCCPFAFAAEADAPSEPEIITEQAEAPAEETPSTEETPPPDESVPEAAEAEETEATEADEPAETAEAAEPAEETEATEAAEELLLADAGSGALPYGLKGLPEGYVLSQKQLADKQNMAEHNVCATTENLTPARTTRRVSSSWQRTWRSWPRPTRLPITRSWWTGATA